MAASTTIKLTNNTGQTVTLVKYHDYHGHNNGVWPPEIEDGQTVEFVFEGVNDESSGAVVYRGKNEKPAYFEWMFAWYNMDGANESYKAYTEIAADGYYGALEERLWNYDYKEFLKMADNYTSVEWNHCVTEATISQQPEGVVYEGKMYLRGGDNRRART